MNRWVAETEIEIQAPIAVVWSIMIDLERYRDWNPFIVEVRHLPERLELGARFQLWVRWSNGSLADSWETVTELAAPAVQDASRQSAGLSYRYSSWLAQVGLVQATREQRLTQAAGQPTLYRTQESFRGLLARFIALADVQDGFLRQALALKTRAEAMAQDRAQPTSRSSPQT